MPEKLPWGVKETGNRPSFKTNDGLNLTLCMSQTIDVIYIPFDSTEYSCILIAVIVYSNQRKGYSGFLQKEMYMRPIRGILLDVDGVLHVSMRPIAGAIEALQWLKQHGYPFYCVSNTTTMASATLAQRLQNIGLPVQAEQLITAPVATASYIRQHFPGKRCWLLTKGDTALDFAGIELVQERADVVIIGGAEELLTYETMNTAFRMLMDGAAFLAMHKNLYWRTSQGLQLDSGPFIRALEIATGKNAIVLGKPEPAFFQQALRALQVAPSETVMVGDDIENDIGGSQQIGIQGVFVCSGKHQMNSPLLKHIRPTAILESVAQLPEWLLSQSSTKI